jgi:aspartate carbamoyltransferase regulatory subunit
MKERKIPSIENGSVIDHLPSRMAPKVAEILSLNNSEEVVSMAMNLDSKKLGKKGIIKVSNRYLSREEVDKIAIIAPDATVNIIEDFRVKQKIPVVIPKELFGVLLCPNPNCITNKEHIATRFYTIKEKPIRIRCHYCERTVEKNDLVIK